MEFVLRLVDWEFDGAFVVSIWLKKSCRLSRLFEDADGKDVWVVEIYGWKAAAMEEISIDEEEELDDEEELYELEEVEVTCDELVCWFVCTFDD